MAQNNGAVVVGFSNRTIPTVSTQTEVVKANHATLVAWLVLNVWPSHLGLPLLISTILLAKGIRRHATFINMCITWMIVGFSSSLLLYAGYQTGPEPPKTLCLIQAALLYAQPGMTSLSAFGLVFQVFYVVRATFREKDPHRNETVRKWSLLVAPYVALTIFAILTAYVGGTNTELVSRRRRFFYCSVKSSSLTNTITMFSFSVLMVTLILEVWIALLTYKHWRILRSNELADNIGLELSLIIRIVAFSVWCTLGISLSLLAIRAPDSPVPDVALATMGSAVMLVFGTQRDVLRAWKFWGPKKETHRRIPSPTKLQASPLPSSHFDHEESPPHRGWRQRMKMLFSSENSSSVRSYKISQPVLREDLSIISAPAPRFVSAPPM